MVIFFKISLNTHKWRAIDINRQNGTELDKNGICVLATFKLLQNLQFGNIRVWQPLHFGDICHICFLETFLFWLHFHFSNICVFATFAFGLHLHFGKVHFLQHLCIGGIYFTLWGKGQGDKNVNVTLFDYYYFFFIYMFVSCKTLQ